MFAIVCYVDAVVAVVKYGDNALDLVVDESLIDELSNVEDVVRTVPKKIIV